MSFVVKFSAVDDHALEFSAYSRGKNYLDEDFFDDFTNSAHLLHDDVLKRVVSINSPKKPFNILNKYASRCRRLNGDNLNFSIYERESQPPLSELEEDCVGVRLVQCLLSCAEKVDKEEYEEAYELLLKCDRMSSSKGSVVERLLFYFSEGLYERIDRETWRVTHKGLGKKFEDPLVAVRSSDETMIAFHNELPVSQITKFAGMQAVVDNVGEARKVHFIDFEIRKGIQCIILMQALVDRCGDPLDSPRISAVCVGGETRAGVEASGELCWLVGVVVFL
ncbi:DELLA protein DWARF8-like [Salvia splendens]|uniref:DELLA protein DWARF8-like n=1 Tax=Salvia splendens TaxID=180675 RepID=UPI001C27B499|nr:DELLA protein DWARF8-like [Salvia splendens]